MSTTAHTDQIQYSFIWNRSHLNIFAVETQVSLLDFRYCLSYGGETPQSLLDYLINSEQLLEQQLDRQQVLANSYSIYQYYDKHHFPLNNVSPEIQAGVLAELLVKLKTEQLVVIDMDDANTLTVYTFSRTSGYSKQSLPGSESLETQWQNHNYHVTYSVAEVLTKANISYLSKSLKLDNAYDTCWLFTGEIVAYFNNSFLDFVYTLFSNLTLELPLTNRIIIDKFALLNYLQALPTQTLSLNFASCFHELPLRVFNRDLLPNKDQVRLNYRDGDQQNYYLQQKRENWLEVKQAGYLYDYLNLDFQPGLLWFWRLPAARKNIQLPKLNLLRFAKPAALKPFTMMTAHIRQSKYTPWRIPVGAAIYKQAEPGVKLKVAKRQSFSREAVEYFIHTPGLNKEELLVVNAQKVLRGEILNRRGRGLVHSSQYVAPVSGTVSLKYLAEGFLAIRTQELNHRDLAWLVEEGQLVTKKLPVNTLEVELASYCLPLSVLKGPGVFNNLVCLHSSKEVEQYQPNLPNLTLVVRETIDYQTLLGLYDKGARAVVAADVLGFEKIASSFWSLYSLGVYSRACGYLPDYLFSQLLLRQYNECYLDPISRELKVRFSDNYSQTFTPEKLPQSSLAKLAVVDDSVVGKGDLVKSLSHLTLFRAAKVLHRDQQDLMLLDLETQQLFADSVDNVKLV